MYFYHDDNPNSYRQKRRLEREQNIEALHKRRKAANERRKANKKARKESRKDRREK